MKIPNLKGLKALGGAAKAAAMTYRSELLLGASVVSTIGAVVASARGGYEARGILDHEKARRQYENEPAPQLKEKIQLTWQCYLPAAGLSAAAVGSTVGLDLVHRKDKKALAAGFIMAVEELKNTEGGQGLIETLTGQDAEESDVSSVAVSTAPGDVEELYLVRDPVTERDFYSNKNKIEEAINHVNDQINKHGSVDLDAFYTYLNWPVTEASSEIGWSGEMIQRGRWGSEVRVDGRPVVTFKFRTRPHEGYDR